jgi:hypothetical protein
VDERVLHALRIIADNDQVSFSGEDLRALLAAYDQATARVAQLEAAGRDLVDEYDNDAASEVTIGDQIDQLRAVLDGDAIS